MGAFILLGPEAGKKQDSVETIKKNFTGKLSSSNTEETVFYAGETPVSTIADTLQNSCLFADSRIVIVKNAELIKKKDDIELLSSCIKKLQNDTVLFLLSDEFKLAAGLDNAVPSANRQIFYEMFEKEKKEWVRNFFKREGYSIDDDAIQAFLELVENTTDALRNEGARLMVFLPKEKNITSQTIEKWLSHNREETPLSLFCRIAEGDLQKALESMSVMLCSKESAVGILIALASYFRKLGDYLALKQEGGADNFVELKKIGLSFPKLKDACIAAARRYTPDGIHECLALTAEYDLLLRSPVAVMESILLDRYILLLFKASAAKSQAVYR